MANQIRRHHHRSVRVLAVLVCTAVGDLAVALAAVANPDVATFAVGTIATLTTAGVATAMQARPTTS